MKVKTSYNNFSRGQIDHDMVGRYDLPIYTSAAEVFENAISNFKGNMIYRTGLENLITFQDCALIEFKYSGNQNYILVLYNTKMRFLSYDGSGNFGWVLDMGSPLEVTTPWNLAESKEIAFRKSFTQNFDSMVISHEDHEPQELTRIAADDFTLRSFARKDDPFPLTWASTQNITAVTQAAEAQISVATHGLSVGDRVRIKSITGMTELNDWTATVLSTPTAGTFTIDVDTTGFTAYSANGTIEKVLTGDYPSLSLYYKGRLYYGATRLRITTIFGSEAGEFKIHTLPGSVTADSAFQFTLAEFTSRIESLFPGQNSLIAFSNTKVLAINGGGVGEPITAESIDTITTSADGANGVEPLTKDGFIFYVSNDDRKMLFFTYDLLTETFVAEDANVISYDITNSGVTKIRHVKTRQDLIFGLKSNGDLVSCNFNESEKIVGWHKHMTNGTFKDIAQISDNDGQQQLFALVLRDSVYYIERQAEYKEFSKREDFYSAAAGADAAALRTARDNDDEAHYRMVAEELKDCIYLDNAGTVSNLQTTTITFDGVDTITDPGNPFVSGDVGKHIVYKTATGYESGRFEITAYVGAGEVTVDVLQTPTTNSYSSWYLTFDTITGLNRFNGFEVAVVADGKFIDTYTVSGGEIELDEQVTQAVVGYLYEGVVKSFVLGFQVQGENTQATMKTITQVGLRVVNSAGGKFGTNRYDLEPVQELDEGDLNYLPPPLMNQTKFLDNLDESERDKNFYIVQDVPLPFQLTSTIIEAEYAVS